MNENHSIREFIIGGWKGFIGATIALVVLSIGGILILCGTKTTGFGLISGTFGVIFGLAIGVYSLYLSARLIHQAIHAFRKKQFYYFAGLLGGMMLLPLFIVGFAFAIYPCPPPPLPYLPPN